MRVKRGPHSHLRHKKVLKITKGQRGSKHLLFKRANEAMLKSLWYATRDRRVRKRDLLLLVGAAGKAKDQKSLALLPDELSFEPYGIALPRGDAAFRLAVNTGLAQIYGTGEIGEIFGRWFGPFGPPSPIIQAIYVLGAIPE